MANRKATFAKRQRETALKERARAKDARRAQLRSEVPDTKGPQIAWDEAVHANATSELPSLTVANEGRGASDRSRVDPVERPGEPENGAAGPPVTSPDPAAPR
jgi:hypothetical protein